MNGSPCPQLSSGDLFSLIRLGLPERRRSLLLLVLVATLGSLAEGSGLLLFSLLLDRLEGAGGDGRLGMALGAYLLAAAAAGAAVWGRTVLIAQARIGCVERLRRRLFAALLEMDWPRLRQVDGPQATQLLTGEAMRIGNGLDFVLQMSAQAVQIGVLALVMARLSPFLAAAVLFLGLAILALALRLDRDLHRSGSAQLRGGQRLQSALADAFQGRRLIKSLGAEADRSRRFDAESAALAATQIEQQRRSATRRALLQIALAAAIAGGFGIAVRGFGLSLGEALVFTLAAGRLGQAILRIRDGWIIVASALPGQQAVTRLLAEAEAAAEPVEAGTLSVPVHAIRLKGVSVRYREASQPALHAIDLTIPAKSITAITGPSGAGKSTLADLVMGLGVPDEGQILLDDRLLDAASRRMWRTRIGYVPQEAFLFQDTLRANLLAAAPEADEAALWAALEQAAVGEVVRRLPQGLDTSVGERGDSLSGGEKQRIALARALLRRPDLLVLDEPTSALDPETERHVLKTLSALRGRITILIVAHRESLSRLADRIVVLERGRLLRVETARTAAGGRPPPWKEEDSD